MTLQVRDATPDDHATFARFFFSFEMPDPLPDLEWWTRFCKDAFFVEEQGKPVGYGLGWRLADSGYVMHVAVDASARNRGVGRVVMRTLAERLKAAGCTKWYLSVKRDNAPAIALYQRVGMRIEHPVSVVEVPWSAVAQLPSSSYVVEPFDAADDAAMEDTFGITRGRISHSRTLPARVLLRARDGERVVGVVSFDPPFPGAPLFRANDESVARALLDGMRPHAKPEFDHVRVVTEGDEPLAARLEAMGGKQLMSLYRMAGQIPSN